MDVVGIALLCKKIKDFYPNLEKIGNIDERNIEYFFKKIDGLSKKDMEKFLKSVCGSDYDLILNNVSFSIKNKIELKLFDVAERINYFSNMNIYDSKSPYNKFYNKFLIYKNRYNLKCVLDSFIVVRENLEKAKKKLLEGGLLYNNEIPPYYNDEYETLFEEIDDEITVYNDLLK